MKNIAIDLLKYDYKRLFACLEGKIGIKLPARIMAMLFCTLFVSACLPNMLQAGQANIITIEPYQTSTQIIQPVNTPENTRTPAPSPTTQIYIIKPNDNLTSIAEQYSVSLEAILSINPGIIPEALVIGETIKIPSADSELPNAEFGTPVPLEIGKGKCFNTIDGTVCILTIRNTLEQDLSNLFVDVTLLDQDMNKLISQVETIPLDILPAGAALPVMARFNNITGLSVSTQLKSAAVTDRTQTNYQILIPDNLRIVKSWDGLSARITGRVNLNAGLKKGILKILVITKDQQGEFTGFNRKEYPVIQQTEPSVEFEISAYSLGPAIKDIDVMIEYGP